MISKGQMTKRILGKPIGSHFRMGSLPPGAALGPYPGLLASYLACPHAVSGGKLSPGPWPPPPGASCHTPERSCASKGSAASGCVRDWAAWAITEGEDIKAARTTIEQARKCSISPPSLWADMTSARGYHVRPSIDKLTFRTSGHPLLL